MQESPQSLLDEGLGRGPMHVGPHGEGELGVLVRLVCGMVGAALGVGFLGYVVTTAGGHPTLVQLASVYVFSVVASVFLPEVWAMVADSHRGG
jgi:hypothetical protein